MRTKQKRKRNDQTHLPHLSPFPHSHVSCKSRINLSSLTFNPETSSSDILLSSLVFVVEVEKCLEFLILLALVMLLIVMLEVLKVLLEGLYKTPLLVLRVLKLFDEHTVEATETRLSFCRAPRPEARWSNAREAILVVSFSQRCLVK